MQSVPSGKREQPSWEVPTNQSPTQKLFLYNSLTRKKELFVPHNGKIVKWYICGPTVYDSSHMGHARTYLTFDILRRVLTDYFGYHVKYVMNITDIDDKIIKRGRQRHLLEAYLEKQREAIDAHEVVQDIINALRHSQKKFEDERDADKKQMYEKILMKVKERSDELQRALRSEDHSEIYLAMTNLLNESREVLSDWLDAEKGDQVNDHSVFDQLAKTYEAEFFSDMSRLNVLPPDVLTRVSEYVPEVVHFVERIVENGYGYAASDGSVYFDTNAFETRPEHFYAKLVPEAFGEVDADVLLKNMREGEGELSLGTEALSLKRNPTDFALWKSSKAGEPFWDSPWGKGRPGWHIECSAMCTEVCGSKLDIHSGGMDLKFPHHDNEIAQVEAYLNDSSWVSYFLHAGTLRIAGLKMSKSLKNFITIRDALKEYSSRQMRILFLMNNWPDPLDYCPAAMERALQFEKITGEFLLLVKDILRKHYKPDSSQGYKKLSRRELSVQENFYRIRGEIDAALCDNIDTRTCIEKLRELVGVGNAFIIEKEKEGSVPNCNLLRGLAAYITNLLRLFGAITSAEEIGFPVEGSVEGNDGGRANLEDTLMPYLSALADFREKVRNVAKEHKITAILEECDRIRDEVLPELGVRLEDRATQSVLKLVDKETLLLEQAQKRAAEAAKIVEKERRAREEAERESAKEAAKRVNPTEMFRGEEQRKVYEMWDEQGIPTIMKGGQEVSKKQRKKLEKLWEAQKKIYDAFLSEESKTNGHT